ncbi:MAG: hypothetical protein RBS89_00920 [Candidatus Delongbacteria bacterium]|nr:hypothetical protein [Candidatus Delongbacteria bacterium]
MKKLKVIETEKMIAQYNVMYEEIKEGLVSRFAKNTTFVIFKMVNYFLSVFSFFISILLFYKYASQKCEDSLYIFICFLALGLMFFAFGKIIKAIVSKRNQITRLSKLLEEMIFYMSNSSAEEKKRFEHFLDEEAAK